MSRDGLSDHSKSIYTSTRAHVYSSGSRFLSGLSFDDFISCLVAWCPIFFFFLFQVLLCNINGNIISDLVGFLNPFCITFLRGD